MRINHISSFPAMWKRIFGASSKSPFTSLERRLLEELTQHLSPDACRLFSAQLERINLVRPIGREVCYWPRVRGKVHHAPEIRFPKESTELKLAAIKFRLAHSQDVWKAEFFVVKGHFFSVVFTPRLPRGTRNEDLEIVSTKILHDPMQPFVPVERSKGPAYPEQFPGWLGEWIRSCRAPQVSQPLPLDQQVRLLEGISATLPTDYLELVRQSE